MKLKQLFLLIVVSIMTVGCYEKHNVVAPRELYTDQSFEAMFPEAEHISIAELKYAFALPAK